MVIDSSVSSCSDKTTTRLNGVAGGMQENDGVKEVQKTETNRTETKYVNSKMSFNGFGNLKAGNKLKNCVIIKPLNGVKLFNHSASRDGATLKPASTLSNCVNEKNKMSGDSKSPALSDCNVKEKDEVVKNLRGSGSSLNFGRPNSCSKSEYQKCADSQSPVVQTGETGTKSSNKVMEKPSGAASSVSNSVSKKTSSSDSVFATSPLADLPSLKSTLFRPTNMEKRYAVVHNGVDLSVYNQTNNLPQILPPPLPPPLPPHFYSEGSVMLPPPPVIYGTPIPGFVYGKSSSPCGLQQSFQTPATINSVENAVPTFDASLMENNSQFISNFSQNFGSLMSPDAVTYQTFPSYTFGQPTTVCMPASLSPSASMELVWHGEFDRLFTQYYPHAWFLMPTFYPPNERWQIFKDSAKVRFSCQCGHGWTSMKGRVIFWFHLNNSKNSGYVLFKLYGQQCIKCNVGNYEHAMWYPEEVVKVIGNVYNRVGQLFYGFVRPPLRIDRRVGKPRNQHNSSLCQACKEGLCKEEWSFS